MKIEGKFEISKSDYIDIYRIHVKYKFKLQKYMIASVLLFAFGMIMQFIGVDLKFANMLVAVVMIAAIALNLIADFTFPKTAYKGLVMNDKDKGKFILDDESLIMIYGKVKLKKTFDNYDSCIETDTAFLLYRKNEFDVLFKSNLSNQMDEVRNILVEKVNKGKKLTIKR